MQTVVALLVLLSACVIVPDTRAQSPWQAWGSDSTPGDLELALFRLSRTQIVASEARLAATVTGEGHWTFRNARGETFTAVGPDEVARAFSLMTSGAGAAPANLTVWLTPQAVFEGRAYVASLPKGATLKLALPGDDVPDLPLRLAADEGAGVQIQAMVRDNLALALDNAQAFNEALQGLTRALEPKALRLISLEPGGPETLKPQATQDPATGAPKPDAIDPYKLAASLGKLRSETVVITGRVDGAYLAFRAPSGKEGTLLLADSLIAARRSDVDLVILDAPAPRQPGSRNWLWQTVDVAGLKPGTRHAALADLLFAVAAKSDAIMVGKPTLNGERVEITFKPVVAASVLPSLGVGAVWTEIAAEVSGIVRVTSMRVELTGRERRREVSWQLVPFLPSWAPVGYLGLMVLGAAGLPGVRTLWLRVARPEERSEYGSVLGFQLARLAKGLLFALVFLPLAGVPGLVLTIFRLRKPV